MATARKTANKTIGRKLPKYDEEQKKKFTPMSMLLGSG